MRYIYSVIIDFLEVVATVYHIHELEICIQRVDFFVSLRLHQIAAVFSFVPVQLLTDFSQYQILLRAIHDIVDGKYGHIAEVFGLFFHFEQIGLGHQTD